MSQKTVQKISKTYCSGSKYVGENDVEWNGRGVYTYPDGTEYHGEFKNGHFHGEGTIITPTKFRLSGIFSFGKCIEYTQLTFASGLEYLEQDWQFCQGNDRRYHVEMEYGIPPVHESYETKEKITVKIPKGYYDAEDGFMNPANASIYSHEDPEQYLATISREEQDWILRYCRHTERRFGFDEKVLQENEKALKLNLACSLEDPCEYCQHGERTEHKRHFVNTSGPKNSKICKY